LRDPGEVAVGHELLGDPQPLFGVRNPLEQRDELGVRPAVGELTAVVEPGQPVVGGAPGVGLRLAVGEGRRLAL